jgi:hypothetical protein
LTNIFYRTLRERSLHRRSPLRPIRVIESHALALDIIHLLPLTHNTLHRLVYMCSFRGFLSGIWKVVFLFGVTTQDLAYRSHIRGCQYKRKSAFSIASHKLIRRAEISIA